jgi:hypothetical protein
MSWKSHTWRGTRLGPSLDYKRREWTSFKCTRGYFAAHLFPGGGGRGSDRPLTPAPAPSPCPDLPLWEIKGNRPVGPSQGQSQRVFLARLPLLLPNPPAQDEQARALCRNPKVCVSTKSRESLPGEGTGSQNRMTVNLGHMSMTRHQRSVKQEPIFPRLVLGICELNTLILPHAF